MSYQVLEEAQVPKKGVWLQLLLLSGFVLSVLIGVGALVGLYILEDTAEQPVFAVDPFALLEPVSIPPDLALLQLTGADASSLARQAASARERHLAYAILRMDPSTAPDRRAADMLRIGQQFLDAGEIAQAVDAFRVARSVAILSPELAPLERGQFLARSAHGFLDADNPDEAMATAIQAQHVAIQSSTLLPAQRVRILQDIAPILRGYGSTEQVQRLAELQRNPNLGLNRVSLESRWHLLHQPLEMQPALQEAIHLREETARRLLQRLEVTGGVDAEAEREGLRQALQLEDQLRAERYGRVNEPGITLAQQHQLIQEQRGWLMLKLRIAKGGFGIELMPDWTGQDNAIQLSLQQVTANLVPVLEAQVAVLSDRTSVASLRAEMLRRLAADAELGIYPDAPLGELTERIRAADAELEELGRPPAFPLTYDSAATPPGFRIAPRY